MSNHDEEQIRTLAYTLWEQDHRPHGRDLEFWFAAEQMLKVSGNIGRDSHAYDKVTIAHHEHNK
ncbi:MAG: DUF2934 domain-containing protein [Magnetococcales bacterium]|nr:DUF2934 domain-containing protein [Magnetococcales bacterium]